MNASIRGYRNVSAALFTLVALLQAGRALLGVPVEIGQQAIPVAASWVIALVLGSLAVWGWRLRIG